MLTSSSTVLLVSLHQPLGLNMLAIFLLFLSEFPPHLQTPPPLQCSPHEFLQQQCLSSPGCCEKILSDPWQLLINEARRFCLPSHFCFILVVTSPVTLEQPTPFSHNKTHGAYNGSALRYWSGEHPICWIRVNMSSSDVFEGYWSMSVSLKHRGSDHGSNTMTTVLASF